MAGVDALRLNGPASTAASEAAYSAARAVQQILAGDTGDRERRPGAFVTMSVKTSYAAVATAASIDAFAPKRLLSRYGRCCFGPIAFTAS